MREGARPRSLLRPAGLRAMGPAGSRASATTSERVLLPEPCLVLLVGPAGAGKTTFARRHFAAGEVLSSDDFRVAIAGDAADQRRNAAVFRALHRAAAARLARRETAVVDATNVEHHARRALLRIAREHDLPAIAIVLDVPLVTALARNAGRPGRTVDPDVVRRQHARLEQALAGDRLASEGFARVVRLAGAAAVDGARIVRSGPVSRRR